MTAGCDANHAQASIVCAVQSVPRPAGQLAHRHRHLFHVDAGMEGQAGASRAGAAREVGAHDDGGVAAVAGSASDQLPHGAIAPAHLVPECCCHHLDYHSVDHQQLSL